MIEINKDNFEAEVLQAKGHVVVEFYRAEGCSNCQKMTPIVEQFEKENPEVKVVKYLCGAQPDDITNKYQFKMFPGIFSFIDGKPVRGFSGMRSPEQMSTIFMTRNDVKANIFDFQELLEQAQGGMEFFKQELENFNKGTQIVEPEPKEPVAPTDETVIHNDTESANK